MNDTSTPMYSRVVHEQRHRDVADPACPLCAAVLRHPAGTALAEVRETVQHDQAVADRAVRAQDDQAWLRHRQWLFTVLAVVLLGAGIVVGFAADRPLNGVHLFGVLIGVGGAGCAIAAWHVHDRRTRGGDDR